MRDVCFCGLAGELADREPIYLGDAEWGLACPGCGRLDRLDWLPADRAQPLIAEARRRQEERQPEPTRARDRRAA